MLYFLDVVLYTKSVITMSALFSGCSSLTSINLSGFNTASVTDMSSMFAGLTSLKMLDLSGLDLSKVNKATNIFENVNTLKYINSMFSGCSSLIDIGGGEFRLC